MFPILGSYSTLYFYSYKLVIGIGLAVALGLVAWQRPRPGWGDGVLICLLAGLVGGRVGFVLANWGYFEEHRPEIWLLWRGTLSYHGWLLAGWITFVIIYRRQWLAMADVLAPAGTILSAFGWLACLLAGYGYGREGFIGPLTAELPDQYGLLAVRYQTQLAAMSFSLLAAIWLWWLREIRLRPGQRFWLALFLLSSGRVILSFFRGDPIPILAGLRLDTLLDSLLLLFTFTQLLRKNDEPKSWTRSN